MARTASTAIRHRLDRVQRSPGLRGPARGARESGLPHFSDLCGRPGWLALALVMAASVQAAALRPGHLRCEDAVNPVGIETLRPQLSWSLESNGRAQRQTAYRVLVATAVSRLSDGQADLWDSGIVPGRESVHIPYAGAPLASRRQCWWRVRVWDQAGRASVWSEPASWEMGLVEATDRQAQWIGRGPTREPRPAAGFFTSTNQAAGVEPPVQFDGQSTLLRRSLQVRKQLRRARVEVTGLGYYELSCNGRRVGDRVLAPAKSNYRRWVLYDIFEVTDALKPGANALGLMLGNGWFNPYPKWWDPYRMQWFGSPRAWLQLYLEYADGSVETVVSDASWRTAPGPVVSACVYDGEVYDATLEPAGWDRVGFDDSSWPPARVVEAPGGVLQAALQPPIRVVEHLRPVRVTQPVPGRYVFDLGQNFSGWVRLTVAGPRGTRVTLRYAEDLKPDGALDTQSNERALATDVYVLKGTGREVYEPHFTFHGFQYVELTGFPGVPTRDSVLGCVVHTDAANHSAFVCDNELINRIHRATLWSQRGNLMGYPMDCPQRDERLGWMGDALVTAEEAMLNFDLPLFFRQWLDGIRLNQNESNGDISIISPRPYMTEEPDPAWSSAYPLTVWQYYQHYGDRRILEEHFDAMRRYVDYLGSQATNGVLPRYWIGDWGTTVAGWQEGDPPSVGTAFYYYDARTLAQVAQVLGKPADALRYQELAEMIKRAHRRAFFDESKGFYDQGSQFSQAFPLFLGLVEAPDRSSVLQTILTDLARHQGHFTVGVLGAKYLIDALTQAGRSDVAYQLATQRGYPSWAHLIEGRTTLSEFWDLHGSHNHVMLGSIDAWFYRVLAGIQPDPEHPGFAHVRIKPFVPESLGWVRANVQTVRGRVAVEWKQERGERRLRVAIPANVTATVHVPATSEHRVRSFPPLASPRWEGHTAIYSVGSGAYRFEVPSRRPLPRK